MISKFDDLVQKVKSMERIPKIAVVAADDGTVIDSLLKAQRDYIAEPIFIGDKARIRELLTIRDEDPRKFDVVSVSNENASQYAIDLIKDGSAQVLMKGLIDSRAFLSPIVKKENDLKEGDALSHLAIFELSNYHKLLMTTDGGMIMYPSLNDKLYIINNATAALHSMGYEKPKHAVVCAIEKVNPKMVESVEAAELQKMNEEGVIEGCIVEGPISYDVAISPQIAKHKGFQSSNVGDFDCMIMPNIHAGNILGKCFTVTANALMAGVITGAKVPIVMTSRGSDEREKYYSIAMAVLMASGRKG